MNTIKNRITAESAKELATKSQNVDYVQEAEVIYRCIYQAAKNGKYSITTNRSSSYYLSNKLREDLLANGYHLSSSINGHTEILKISWDN